MFQMGRYDPTAEARKRENHRESEVVGRDRNTHRNSRATRDDDNFSENGDNFEVTDRRVTKGRLELPKSGHSSSSVPSSSDSDDNDEQSLEPDTRTKKPMEVIAPKQKTLLLKSVGTTWTDEAHDDFDVENDNVEDMKQDNSTRTGRSSHPSEEVTTALHMSSLPIKDAADTWDLAPFLVENLQRDGYEHFFPIQSLVIPDVISSERHSHIRARDVCVAAPTGSGKTLAFVLPVLNSLSTRQVRRLRALVVLPSRDLATQVFKVFDRYTRGSDLRVGLAVGQSDFVTEQEALTVGTRLPSRFDDVTEARHRYLFHRESVGHALEAFSDVNDDSSLELPKGGKSAVDVLVATPGRLVDHLDQTPGFTLQHLRFLVIDEADRLVNQSYHNWIDRVTNATNEASVREWNKMEHHQVQEKESFTIDPITWRHGGTAGDNSSFNTNDSYSSVVASVCRPVQLRKLLYSATLTKDPQKLAALGLVNPKHFDAHFLNRDSQASGRQQHQRYSMPPGLSEHTVECTAEQKPLVLLALVLEYVAKEPNNHSAATGGIIVVFTSSLDSTHRLVRLLQLIWVAANLGEPHAVAEFSSSLSQEQRSSLMKRCNTSDGKVSVVVCSDSMSRGMDLPFVVAVINYDVPSFAKTYVHRCGRTARAGREGTAISVLKGGQVSQFQRMRGLIEFPDRVTSLGVKKELVRTAMPYYGPCVKTLRKVIEAERDGGLNSGEMIPSSWIPSGVDPAAGS